MASLINLGNTCAINSILQAISHTFNVPNKNPEKPFTKSLFNVITLMQNNPNKILKPTNFIKQFFQTFHDEFKNGYQMDSQELWLFLSNTVFLETSYKLPPQNFHNTPLSKQAYEQISLHNNHMTSLWNNHYQGSTITIIKCLECNNKIFNFETFYEINVNPDNNTISMLQNFFSFQELQDDWICDTCKKSTKYMKSVKLWHAPSVLVICIKRYNNNLQKTRDEIHINKNIHFGSTSILSSPNTTKQYTLKAIVNHYGFYGGGHYDCTIVHKDNSIHYDDCTKTQHSLDLSKTLRSKNAYMLFYIS